MTIEGAPILFIVRGITGSGKTTFVKNQDLDCIHLEADMLCVKHDSYQWELSHVHHNHVALHKIAKIVMDRGADLIISNTFTRKWEFRDYVDYAHNKGYNVEVYRMCNEYESTHSVPQEAIQRMKDRFEDYEGETLVYN